ncbi:hypothetical protein JN11_00412 [Mucilaginibacter frigoritolerans]|jgi:hypothetical protein|uniref:Uncharacterized protein n=1 Tax=Mucilaginibacter frigoritolerans TaxID=652788 RepID=A0A562UHR4_9SPHI|nr:DUF6886 family protein [Mucilaginibacter frigoritolerans]TWJ04691.1 hypothetical protein JN11_00412 [Mucilaginibacter frigoritolerans]
MSNHLFHISEEPGIKIFEPRPSPSKFDSITSDVVFAISEKLMHNYLLPRDCPRVTYYASAQTTKADRDNYFKHSSAYFVVVAESGWYERIINTTLYCYAFLPDPFILLDECAGYYISHKPVEPIKVKVVNDLIGELLQRNIELRFTPDLTALADAVSKSTLGFSLIRMRNARQK